MGLILTGKFQMGQKLLEFFNNNEMEAKDIYYVLVQYLKLIALPAEKQIQVLPDFVLVPDEIALGFDDIYLMIPQIKQNAMISVRGLELLRELDQLFEKMSGKPLFWSLEYFEYGELWKKIRQLACSILDELKEPVDIPDLGFTQWIKTE